MQNANQRALFGHVESFNRDLRVLVRDLAGRYPDDATIHRAQKRVMTVIDLDPLYVINEVGPYLYKYRAEVYELETSADSSEAFFLDNEYDTELKASVDHEKADLVKYIIPKAKECVRTLEPDERAQYKQLVVRLLDAYVEYLAELKLPARGAPRSH